MTTLKPLLPFPFCGGKRTLSPEIAEALREAKEACVMMRDMAIDPDGPIYGTLPGKFFDKLSAALARIEAVK